jgi:hypothetical protein
MNEPTPIRPSGWYYWLALPLIVLGTYIGTHIFSYGLRHATDSLTQIVVPGEINLALQSGKSYTVFYEQRSIVNGRIYSSRNSLSGLQCRLSPQDHEGSIPLRNPGSTANYTIGGRSGRSILQFSVARDGEYHFSCDDMEPSSGQQIVLAVGDGVGPAILRMILASFATVSVTVLLSMLIFFRVYIRRDNAKACAAAARLDSA